MEQRINTIKELYRWAVEHQAEDYSILIGDDEDAADLWINCLDDTTEVVIVNR